MCWNFASEHPASLFLEETKEEKISILCLFRYKHSLRYLIDRKGRATLIHRVCKVQRGKSLWFLFIYLFFVFFFFSFVVLLVVSILECSASAGTSASLGTRRAYCTTFWGTRRLRACCNLVQQMSWANRKLPMFVSDSMKSSGREGRGEWQALWCL